jgi:ankyrin repeat protein
MSFTPEAIVERHHNKIHRANFDLAEACCFPNPDCIHRQIQNAILGTSTKLHDLLRTVPAVDEVSGSVNNLLVGMLNNPTLQSINTPDSNGNNALFFAARSAAPAEVLLPILHRTANINAVNKDGQTFLFLLDPERLHGHPCVCTRGPLGGPFLSHTSSMGCLMSDLERWHFNFEQLDHDCRSFLSFQCASPYFDIEWFRAQMEQTPEWARRLVCLSRVHDSSAMSYVCFIAEGTKRAEVVSLISQWGSTAILTKENTDHYDEYGRTELVNCVESVYMVGGESRVLSDVKKMVSRGVNINGRSRDGSTALIAAAQRCYPDMVAYLLKMGAHVDHRDEYGFTAMDYAAEGFNRSRGRNVAAAVTARFFKSATRLLEYTKLSRSKTQTPEASVLQNLNHSASRRARRSLASMTILEQYRAEG